MSVGLSMGHECDPSHGHTVGVFSTVKDTSTPL